MVSKSQSIVITVLLIVLTGFCGFLAWQFLELRSAQEKLTTQTRDQFVDTEKADAVIESLRKEIKTQADSVKEIAKKLDELPDSLKSDLKKEFVPLPQYAVAEPLYISEPAEEGVTKIIGNLSALDAWMDRNKLFLDYIIQESLILDLDAKTQKVVVTEVVADSVFYQMGLRKGDLIQNVDGAAIFNGDDLRVRLMETVPAKVLLMRGEQKVTLEISYK